MKTLVCLATLLAAFTLSAKYQDDLIPGGQVIRPGTYVKSIAIVNAQDLLQPGEVEAIAAFLDDESGFCVKAFRSDKTDPAALKNETQSELVLIVKNVPSEPKMLVAPDDRWAVINLANLVEDLPAERAKKKFFTPRARKQIIKAFSLLCGGGSSQFPSNIMNTASPRELDMVKEQIPADMLNNYDTYLRKLGFKPKELVPYEIACEEGWAPQPTNDQQRAIWQKVRMPPTEPMKISFDPKTDTK